MSLTFYIGDYGPVPAVVTEEDGITPATPLSATATVVNSHTGVAVVTDASCFIEPGVAAYIIPSLSPITATSARYVAYISVVIDATTKLTVQVPFDVLDKTSNLIVDRWRRKVEFAAPNDDAISDQEGRDWIDQAVSYLNGHHFNTGYTSVLASLSPSTGVEPAGYNEIEFFASVAALMARTAWWAGKGNWRDEEMSFDGTPFQKEWSDLRSRLEVSSLSGWFASGGPVHTTDMYNRDKTDRWGISDDPDNYYEQVWAQDNQAEL